MNSTFLAKPPPPKTLLSTYQCLTLSHFFFSVLPVSSTGPGTRLITVSPARVAVPGP